MIRSMTREERQRPQILNGSRRKRIALGSGTSVQEVNRLLKQYEQMQKMMKMMGKGGGMAKMMRGMKGMMPGMR
jgi:signal recognition particle subunit SRP54